MTGSPTTSTAAGGGAAATPPPGGQGIRPEGGRGRSFSVVRRVSRKSTYRRGVHPHPSLPYNKPVAGRGESWVSGQRVFHGCKLRIDGCPAPWFGGHRYFFVCFETEGFLINLPPNKGPPIFFVPCPNRSPPPDPQKSGPNRGLPPFVWKMTKKTEVLLTTARIEVHPRGPKKLCHRWSRVDLHWEFRGILWMPAKSKIAKRFLVNGRLLLSRGVSCRLELK